MSAEGQAILSGLGQLEQCAMGLKADIQALGQELNNKLDKTEKPNIIQDSVSSAVSQLNPEIAAVGITAATGLGLANQALGGLAGLLGSFNALNIVVGGLVATVAALGVLFSKVSSLEAWRPSVDGMLTTLANGVVDAKNRADTAFGQALLAKGMASNAQDRADAAYDYAEYVSQKADAAMFKAGTAMTRANDAITIGNYAVGQANTAIADADAANAQATTAIKQANAAMTQANNALGHADYAVGQANIANQKADAATLKANDALTQASDAIGKADIANGKSDKAIINSTAAQISAVMADIKAGDAIKTANTAISAVNALELAVYAIAATADNAQLTANGALGLAGTAMAQNSIQDSRLTGHDAQFANLRQNFGNLVVTASSGITAQLAALTAYVNTQLQNAAGITANLASQIQAQQQVTGQQLQRINTLENNFVQTDAQIQRISANLQAQQAMNTQALGQLTAIGAAVTALPTTLSFNQTYTNAMATASAAGTCRTTQPGGCLRNQLDALKTGQNNLQQGINNLTQAGQGALLTVMNTTLNTVNTKLGAQIANGGISGAMGRLSNFLGLERVFSALTLATSIHNAYMLSNALKTTLLETIASLGNATGLMQTPEGDNVDLNAEYDKSINLILKTILGQTLLDDIKAAWIKYNRIYQAASNSVNACSNMINAVGNVVQTSAEYTGRIGNSLKGAGMVAENAYAWMSEKFDAKMSRFLKFETTVGTTIQALEVVNEIAQSVVEGQTAATEFQKANTEFVKAVKDAQRDKGSDNTATATAENTAKTEATALPSVTAGKTETEDMLDSLISNLFN